MARTLKWGIGSIVFAIYTMTRIFKWLKRESLHIAPVFLFFFIAFNIINATEGFLLKKAGLETYTLLDIAVAAALIAKIFLVIDHLPVNLIFLKKPLIYIVVGKTLLYWVIAFLVRMGIRLFPFLFYKEGLKNEWNLFLAHVDWRLVLSVQTWYLMLLFLFVASRELALVIGPKKMHQIFFLGKRRIRGRTSETPGL